jgi:hypothetical protein
LEENDIGWTFPSTLNGQIKGVADAGIETFNGDGLKALTRETCQNSLDAVRDETKPVKMEFYEHAIAKRYIPGMLAYKEMLNKSYDYWRDNSEKAAKFLWNAKEKISQNAQMILRVSDYNTEGLSEPYKNGFGSWNALTKIDGGATKSGDSAGSYGIGKNAPYVCTAYRMVFYRTLNIASERAAQGMSRLLSYEVCDNEYTTGTGYYGNKENNGPVESIYELDNIWQRNEIGTDIFIYGTNLVDTSKIKTAIFSEILDNFLIAIYKGKLEVSVQKDFLSGNNISEYFEKYKRGIKDSYCAWQAISREDAKEITCDFHGMGTLRLRILIDYNENLNRKILITRASGMKLFLMKDISKTISFSGILELEGKELNKFFREMETPSHDKWKPDMHSEPERAKKYVQEVKDWVSKEVNEFGTINFSDESDVKGLSSTLNEQIDDSLDNYEKSEYIKNLLGEVKVEAPIVSNKMQGFLITQGGNIGKLDETQKKMGTLDKDAKNAAIRTLHGTRKRTRLEKHHGRLDESGHDIVAERVGGETRCQLENVRVIRIGMGEYRISFNIPVNVASGRLEVVTIGENSRSIKLNIAEVNNIQNCKIAGISDGGLLLEDMLNEKKIKLDFSLYDTRNYAMEVRVYEHN